MWVRFLSCIVVAATCASLHGGSGAFAADVASPELRTAVRQMFDQGWEKTSEGLADAERNHRRAKTIAPSDARADFALALLQMRYVRFIDAEKTLIGVVADDPDLWAAQQLKIRLSIVMKKHSTALTELDQFSARLAAAADDATREEQRNEGVEFLGRMFAFYDGPAATGIAGTAVADTRARILKRLTPTEQDTFNRGYGQVSDKFLALDDDRRRTADDAKVAEQQQKERDLQRLADEKQGVAAERDAVNRRAQESEATARAAVGQIDAELAPLNAAFLQISAQGQSVQREIARLDITIRSLLSQADSTDDPNLRAQLLQQADFVTVQLRRAQRDYQALDFQATQINVQRSGLLQRRAQATAQYEAEMKQLGVVAKQLAGTEKRIATQTRTALEPATGRTPQVQAKTSTAASLTTYVELPLDREKDRLLASFEP